jgi:exodeoxyribonuclease X
MGRVMTCTTRIRVIDIETTGVDPHQDRIVEIAAYDLCLPDFLVVRVDSLIVNPGRPIPAEVSAVHHLTDVDVALGCSFQVAWGCIIAPAEPPFTIFAAHNCEFERSFLPTLPDVGWICTYKVALRAWPNAPAHNNQTLRYWRGLDTRAQQGFDRTLVELAHRAEPNAYVTAWLLGDLLSQVSLADAIAWSKEPKVFPALSFGKHRGAKWSDVPTDYLQWLRDGQHSMDTDWRHGAKLELARRQGGAAHDAS